jgi:hypothetical protein
MSRSRCCMYSSLTDDNSTFPLRTWHFWMNENNFPKCILANSCKRLWLDDSTSRGKYASLVKWATLEKEVSLDAGLQEAAFEIILSHCPCHVYFGLLGSVRNTKIKLGPMASLSIRMRVPEMDTSHVDFIWLSYARENVQASWYNGHGNINSRHIPS